MTDMHAAWARENVKAAEAVRAYTPTPDLLNEWVVEVEGVRRARYVGPDAVFYAARSANEWRRALGTPAGPSDPQMRQDLSQDRPDSDETTSVINPCK